MAMDDSSNDGGAKPKAKKASPKKVVSKLAHKPGDLNRAAERLKQVSDPTRLRVLMALADAPLNVTQLRDELGGIQSGLLGAGLCFE